MEDLEEIIEELLKATFYGVISENCNGLLLSGGIDTSFVAIATYIHNLRLKAITVVYDRSASDLRYAKIVANKLELKHRVIYGLNRDIEKDLEELLKILRVIDPIEISCSLPIYIGIVEALSSGLNCIATGDGGDELFFGYDFLLDKSLKELDEWIKYVIRYANFSSVRIGSSLGIRVLPALFTKRVIKIALKVPSELKIAEVNGKKYGKYILRKALEFHGLKEVAWRRKEPVNIGSGFYKVLEEWASKVDIEEALKVAVKARIRFPSRLHVYLYKKLEKLKLLSKKYEDTENLCPICRSSMKGNFCSFCGTYVDDMGNFSFHYKDELWNYTSKLKITKEKDDNS